LLKLQFMFRSSKKTRTILVSASCTNSKNLIGIKARDKGPIFSVTAMFPRALPTWQTGHRVCPKNRTSWVRIPPRCTRGFSDILQCSTVKMRDYLNISTDNISTDDISTDDTSTDDTSTFIKRRYIDRRYIDQLIYRPPIH
jgi:hypothetical protein